MRSRRSFLQLILSAPMARALAANLPYALANDDDAPAGNDLAIVRSGIQRMLVGNASPAMFTAAANLAPSLDANGVWPGIDYRDQSRSVWKTSVHLLFALQL